MLVMLVRACKQVSSYSHLFVAILSKQHEWRLWDDLISIPCLHHLASSFWHNMRTYILTSHRTRRNQAARWGFHCTSATLPTSERQKASVETNIESNKRGAGASPSSARWPSWGRACRPWSAGFVLRSKTFLRSRDQWSEISSTAHNSVACRWTESLWQRKGVTHLPSISQAEPQLVSHIITHSRSSVYQSTTIDAIKNTSRNPSGNLRSLRSLWLGCQPVRKLGVWHVLIFSNAFERHRMSHHNPWPMACAVQRNAPLQVSRCNEFFFQRNC